MQTRIIMPSEFDQSTGPHSHTSIIKELLILQSFLFHIFSIKIPTAGLVENPPSLAKPFG